jgi:hypothetical protein
VLVQELVGMALAEDVGRDPDHASPSLVGSTTDGSHRALISPRDHDQSPFTQLLTDLISTTPLVVTLDASGTSESYHAFRHSNSVLRAGWLGVCYRFGEAR